MTNIKNILHWCVIVFITAALLEVTLRIQQSLGPICDLELGSFSMDVLSDTLNHKPARISERKFPKGKCFGKFAGFKFAVRYDSIGIRLNSSRPAKKVDGNELSILFMGDSFMKGYDDNNTIPQHAWNELKRNGINAKIYNAGEASYSPSIFIPQSKHLIPKLKPDYIVVDIDETDLGDDFIKYRHLTMRDDSGKIVGVKTSPPLYEYTTGLLRIKKHPLYLVRFMLKMYHLRYFMPKFENEYRKDKRHPLSFSLDKDANLWEKYKEEIDYFYSTVDELATTLINLIGDNKKVIFVYHPHLQHLKPDKDGHYFNNLVSRIIYEVAKKHYIAFYNATDDLKAAFGKNHDEYYWSGDMHFNFEGLSIYGKLVGKRIFQLLDEK